MIPCESAAFRRMPAFFIAAVRSGPCGIARASSSGAACASASKSSSGRLFLAMVKKLHGASRLSVRSSTLRIERWVFHMELGRYQVSRGHLGKKYTLQISLASGTGQTHKAFRVYHGAPIEP